MNLSIVLFLAATAALLILPLIPSLLELRNGVDSDAIAVSGSSRNDTRHFATSFRELVETQLQAALWPAMESGQVVEGATDRGDRYVVVPGEFPFEPHQSEKKEVDRILASANDLQLPDQISLKRECYAAGSIRGGRGSRYRAAYADVDVRLAQDSCVERWVHAERDLHVHEATRLYGRASAGRSIQIHGACGFQRMRAPSIEIGSRLYDETWRAGRIELTELVPQSLSNAVDFSAGRTLIEGDCELSRDRRFPSSLVVHGTLRVRQGTHIEGSVKAHGNIILEHGVRIDGSVVAHGDINVGAGCRIEGPVLSEAELKVGERTQIGDGLRLSSVQAKAIEISQGCLIHGMIWASDTGKVLS